MKKVVLASIAVAALTSSAALAQSTQSYDGGAGGGANVSVGSIGGAAALGGGAGGSDGVGFAGANHGMDGYAIHTQQFGGASPNGIVNDSINFAGVHGYNEVVGGGFTTGPNSLAGGLGLSGNAGTASAGGGGGFGSSGMNEFTEFDPNDNCNMYFDSPNNGC